MRWTKEANSQQKLDDRKAFFDANVLLEVLDRRQYAEQAIAALRRHGTEAYISALTGHLVMYFGPKAGVEREILRQFLLDYHMQSVGATEFAWAFQHMQGTDFEDALQLACAVSVGAALFYTFDKELARHYQGRFDLEIIALGG